MIQFIKEGKAVALFDTKGLSNKLGGMKEKVSGAISDAKLDEKFGKVRQQMGDSFIFKPENLARKEWFGEENFVIPYDKVTKLEIVKRQVSMTEAMMSSNGETKSLEQMNNINISYLDGEGTEQMVRIEMLTGFNIYKQAEKCQELMDLLREKKILNKFRGEEKRDGESSGDDVFAQIEKLAALKEKGLISEEEFNQKKTVLLEKL